VGCRRRWYAGLYFAGTGEGAARDHRSDIYSLGVMLYEMLAGSRRIQVESAAVMNERLLHDPEPVRKLRKEVAPELEEILNRLGARPAAALPDSRGHGLELEHQEQVAWRTARGGPCWAG